MNIDIEENYFSLKIFQYNYILTKIDIFLLFCIKQKIKQYKALFNYLFYIMPYYYQIKSLLFFKKT